MPEGHATGGGPADGRRTRDILHRGLVWFLIPGAVHAAVILLLTQLTFLIAQKAEKEAVIDTALEEIDIRDNPVEHLAPTNIRTSAVSDRRPDWAELLKPDPSRVTGPDERNLLKMMEATEDVPTHLRQIAVPIDGLSAIPKVGGTQETKSSVAAVVDALSREVGKILTKRNVLLVWLFDESLSMRQRQKEVRERVVKVYEELTGAGEPGSQQKLVSAVWGFGDKVHRLLEQPSAAPQQVQTAIDRVGVGTTGKEHVMAAVRDAINFYKPFAHAQKRALVIFIVTDEVGDDVQHVEEVVAMAKGIDPPVRVFVLGGEAKFQKKTMWRWDHSPAMPAALRSRPDNDPDKRKWWVPSAVDAGPESAFPEILNAYDYEGGPWWQPPWTMSGFGFWALSRLASVTDGMYYIVHGEKGPTYDPAVMEPYAPELCSQNEFIQRCKLNRVRDTLFRLHDILEEVKLTTSFPVDGLRGALEEAATAARKRVKVLSDLILIVEGATLANSPTAARRWEAIRELSVADLYAERWSANQYILALEDFIRQPKLDSRATSYHAGTDAKNPQRGGERAAAELKVAVEKYEAVIAHHPGTPWAFVAQKVRRLNKYAVGPYIPPTGGGPGTPPPPPSSKM